MTSKHGLRKGFFQGRGTGGFFQHFSRRGAKSGEISFFPLETKKIFIYGNFQISGGQGPFAPRSDANALKYTNL